MRSGRNISTICCTRRRVSPRFRVYTICIEGSKFFSIESQACSSNHHPTTGESRPEAPHETCTFPAPHRRASRGTRARRIGTRPRWRSKPRPHHRHRADRDRERRATTAATKESQHRDRFPAGVNRQRRQCADAARLRQREAEPIRRSRPTSRAIPRWSRTAATSAGIRRCRRFWRSIRTRAMRSSAIRAISLRRSRGRSGTATKPPASRATKL